MCGIYGSTRINQEKQLTQSKLDCLIRRGPDFQDFKTYSKNVIFGHTRLAIIDLDARSNQPFEYEKIKIVFNGEIYNFQELKGCLVKKGYSFRTSSDTEVICAAYLEWGSECLNKLNGMFSLVIFDEEKDILFGARDRLGKKPMFYLCKEDFFEFSSQMSSLILGNKLELDQNKIAEYLFFGHQPKDGTIFKEVKKLEPGHYFEYSLSTSNLSIKKYWGLNYNESSKGHESFTESKENIKNLLFDSVKIRLISDVPIGVFLSGGVDSSIVTAIAAKISSEPIKTFSIGFKEDDFDESIYAENVAKHIGTEHTTIICDMNEAKELVTNYEIYVDEPFADASAIPSMLLAKNTKKNVTVALTGDGGDELFLGYSRYRWMNQISNIYKLPKSFRLILSQIIKLNPGYRSQIISKAMNCKSLDELYIYLMGTFKTDWFNKSYLSINSYVHELKSFNSRNLLEKLSDFDIINYLNDDINTKVDRASMSFSLETRSPLMDYRLYEYVKKLDTSYKYKNGNQKIILKSILEDMIDPKLFDRPKSGFGMPLKHWFRNDLKDFVFNMISDGNIDKIECIDRQGVLKLFNEHAAGTHNHSVELWRLIVLFKWLKNYS